MSPRSSAIVAAVIAVPLAAASVFFLPTGGVASLLAAFGLAGALAGLGLAILWFGRTSWEPEPASPPRTVDRAEAQRRVRRSLRVQGYLGIALGVGLLLLLLWIEDPARATVVRWGLFSGLVIVVGIASLVVARAVERRGPREEDASGDGGVIGAGWVRVSRRDRASVLIFALPGLGGFLWGFWQLVPALFSTARWAPPVVPILIAVLAVAVAAAGVGWAVRQVPDVWVDVAARLVPVGGREIPWSALTAARVTATAALMGGTRSLLLTLEGAEKTRVPLLLRRRGELAMTPDERRVVLALVEGAAIALPRAAEDPRGKFSRVLYPMHLDAAQARDLVARPPRSDEDLPVPVA